jgi:hypothetical protein
VTRWIYRLPANQTLLEAIVALEPGQGFVLYAQVFRDGRWMIRAVFGRAIRI